MELRYAKLIIKDTSLPSKFNISSKVEDCVKTVIPDLPSLELELKVNIFNLFLASFLKLSVYS